MNRKKNKDGFRETDISGKWRVAELPDLVDDYLDLSPDPHVLLQLRGRGEIDGTYEFGAQSGAIDGRLERLNDGRVRLSFTFEGNDELDPVHGYGEAILVDEATLDGYMRYHLGDTYRFTWKREKQAGV
jgi:hypothetical protein